MARKVSLKAIIDAAERKKALESSINAKVNFDPERPGYSLVHVPTTIIEGPPGPPGPRGQTGPVGPAGRDGETGSPGTVDLVELAKVQGKVDSILDGVTLGKVTLRSLHSQADSAHAKADALMRWRGDAEGLHSTAPEDVTPQASHKEIWLEIQRWRRKWETMGGTTISGVGGAIELREEGSSLGLVTALDVVGSTATATASSGVGTLTISAGITGISVEDEGVTLGTTGTVDTLNFVGSTVEATRAGNEVTLTFTAGVSNHNLLDGLVHTDTLVDSVTDGDVIIGNATPKWSSLAITVPAANVRNVLGVDNTELRPSWKTALDSTNPADIAITASPGTSLIFAHRDHVHKLPSNISVGIDDDKVWAVGMATGL